MEMFFLSWSLNLVQIGNLKASKPTLFVFFWCKHKTKSRSLYANGIGFDF